jgi:sporulation protein YlmC with PRC-barrel domain
MTKTLLLGAAVGALTLTGALTQPSLAQTTGSNTPPAAAQAAKPDVISSQQPNLWLASKFKGTDVIGTDNKSIGDVSDILFDKSGKIEAYVVSVGGFLGVGAKDVALASSTFQMVPGSNSGADKLKRSMNANELKQAQNFTPHSPPSTTTGMGSGGMGSPASSGGLTGGTHPPTNTPSTGR